MEVVTKRDLFRMAFIKWYIIEDTKEWYEYQQKRNITFQTHDKLKADSVCIKLQKFL